MKKNSLPRDWIMVNSKSYPDRVYYFNVKTKKSVWNQPDSNRTETKDDDNVLKKRKLTDEDNSNRCRATTPELQPSEESKRQKISNVEKQSSSSKRKETPQMIALREKILQKKMNNTRRSMPVSSPVSTTDEPLKSVQFPESTNKNKSSECTTVSNTHRKSRILTPQMEAMYEKMQQKNKKDVPRHSIATTTMATEDMEEKRQVLKPRYKSTNIATNIPAKKSVESSVTLPSPTSDFTTTSYERNKTPRENFRAKNSMSDSNNSNVESRQPLKQFIKEAKVLEKGKRATKSKFTIGKIQKNKGKQDSVSQSALRKPVLKKLAVDCKKNLAKERMDKLQSQLQKDNKKSTANQSQSSEEILLIELDDSNEDCQIEKVIETVEEMDWEPLEDEKITVEVQAIRTHLCINNNTNAVFVPDNALGLPSSLINEGKKTLYVIIDTNVFLTNISAIEDLRDIKFKNYGQPIIVIPWTVIRELDYIKDNKSNAKSESLRKKARTAVRFLHEQFSSKHPRIIGQTSEDVVKNKEKFATECPDDEILQTCLQIRDVGKSVVLLSYDKNLCNKAMIYDVIVLGRDEPFEKIDYLLNTDNRSRSFCSFYLSDGTSQDTKALSIPREESRLADEIFVDIKSILKEILTIIVSEELKRLYGNDWEKYATISPPWTVTCVLKCAVKHWIAAVSEGFGRKAEFILRDLLQFFNNLPMNSGKLKKVECLLEKCYDLTEMINAQRYLDLKTQACKSIDKLKEKYRKYEIEISKKKIHEKIGTEEDIGEQKRRAEKAFQYLEAIYAYARDIGGMASEIAGMPCTFCYKIPNPPPTVDYVRNVQPEVAANVNSLLHVLSAALGQTNDSSVNHRTLISLYHTLTAFSPESLTSLACNLSPLDIYCCLKHKEEELKTGIHQLQELSTHFCKLASYRCS